MAAGDELTHIGSQKCRPVWIPFSRPLHLEGAGSGAIVVMRYGDNSTSACANFTGNGMSCWLLHQATRASPARMSRA